MDHKLKILWNSNSLWSPSGYGQQTAEIVPLIANEGYNIATSNFYGQSGGKFVLAGLENVIQYPVINHTYGSDAMLLHGRDFQADIHITLQDIWALNPQDLLSIPRFIPWLPVDQDPIPTQTLDILRFAYRVIAMSKFGQEQLAKHGIASTCIPHSVNTQIFKPMDKQEMRKKYGVPPQAYLVGIVGANKENPPRKSFQEAMDAFKEFSKEHENALLYIHTFADFPGGFPVREYAKVIGILDRLAMPDPYTINFNTSKHHMAEIYNTFDVFLGPSISEGFQIPVIEAQACGIPAIVNNFTAPPELVRHKITGYRVDVAYKRFSPAGSFYGIPSVNSIIDGLNWAYSTDRKNTQKRAVDWIKQNYATDLVFEKMWKPYLQKLENEVYEVVEKPSQTTSKILTS